MKILSILLAMMFVAPALAWRCDLSTYTDPSEVDKCFLRITEHYLHSAKAHVVYVWQNERNKQGGTLSSAGELWRDQYTEQYFEKIKLIQDTKDRLVREGIYAVADSIDDLELSCSSDDDD